MTKKEKNINNELMRFTTAGSIDDGKSTLIGRLLYDSKSIYQDQYEAIKVASERRGEEGVNLALLTDGLKSEREQGITIDVAYRYFSTPKRKFIIADTPGHIQYTGNMVTGASTANVALILIDARNGVVEQTKRHATIASLLQIPHIVVCINKMDLVDYDQAVYDKIQADFKKFTAKLDVSDIHFIPISALLGDNVVKRSTKTPWYDDPTLMYYLENVHIAGDHNSIDVRFPIQHVIRPNKKEWHDYRGYAGRMAGGTLKKGDDVRLLPSGFISKIKLIQGPAGEQTKATTSESVTILIEDDYDLSRGDMIIRAHNSPSVSQDIEIMLVWFDQDKPLQEQRTYALMQTTKQLRCVVKKIRYRLNINTLHRDFKETEIKMNEVARVVLRTTEPLFVDAYRKNRITGSLILIDESTNNTVGAGMVI